MKNLPRIEYDGRERYVGGPIYKDIRTLLDDVRDGIREYPQAELYAVDDPQCYRLGFQIFVTEGDVYRYWNFYISCQDFNRSVEQPEAPAEWVAMRTCAGRQAMVGQLRKEAGLESAS